MIRNTNLYYEFQKSEIKENFDDFNNFKQFISKKFLKLENISYEEIKIINKDEELDEGWFDDQDLDESSPPLVIYVDFKYFSIIISDKNRVNLKLKIFKQTSLNDLYESVANLLSGNYKFRNFALYYSEKLLEKSILKISKLGIKDKDYIFIKFY